jgi:hypothetical protein
MISSPWLITPCYRRLGLFDRFWPCIGLAAPTRLNAWVEAIAIASTTGRAAATKFAPHEGQGIVSRSVSRAPCGDHDCTFYGAKTEARRTLNCRANNKYLGQLNLRSLLAAAFSVVF